MLHKARPDDSNEPGDWCKDCGQPVSWIGPSQYDWVHIGGLRDMSDSQVAMKIARNMAILVAVKAGVFILIHKLAKKAAES